MRGRRLWLGLLLGVTCWGCASEPSRFAYAISSSAVSAYRIDPKTAALTRVPGSPLAVAGKAFGGAAVTPSGRFLYIGHRGVGPRGAGVGLSGVGYALFGFLWVNRGASEKTLALMSRSTVRLFVLWFFVCIALTAARILAFGNVAHARGEACQQE